jgi:branched-chain amino acid transport system permease protein
MELANFIHGEMIGVGGYIMYAMVLFDMGEIWMTLTVVIAAVLLERVAFRPAREAPATTGLLTAFGVSIILHNVLLLGVSPRPKNRTGGLGDQHRGRYR